MTTYQPMEGFGSVRPGGTVIDIADYNQLKMMVELLINEGMHKACKPLETMMVDLGYNFYDPAKVEDCSKNFDYGTRRSQ